IVNGDRVAGVLVASFGNGLEIGAFGSVELFPPVGGVTERLVARTTAPAETPGSSGTKNVAVDVPDLDVADDAVRTMFGNENSALHNRYVSDVQGDRG